MSQRNILEDITTEIGNYISFAVALSQNMEEIHMVVLSGITRIHD